MLIDKEFKKIKTRFCFLDETGLIHNVRDKFFAIGIVKCDNPEKLYNKIRKVRQRHRYNEELKWANLDRKIRFDIARDFFNVFLSEKAIFHCIILDKEKLDFEKYYDNNLYKVYRNFTIVLLKLIIGSEPKDISAILADDYFAPDGIDLEDTIKKFTNDHYKDFTIFGVCQIDSRSSDLLQLTDLILGSILYDLKKHKGLIEGQGRFKKKFLNFLYQKLETKESCFCNDSGKEIESCSYLGGKIKATIFNHEKSIRKK
jgi:hypothetical protein